MDETATQVEVPNGIRNPKRVDREVVMAILLRKRASAMPLWIVFTKLNQVVRGWINYYGISSMSTFLQDDFGPWLRHKVRVVIVKQWKRCRTIYRNLMTLRRITHSNISTEEIYATANTRRGLYKKCDLKAINYLLSPAVLAMPGKKDADKGKSRPGLVDPYALYLNLRTRTCM